MNKYLKKLTDPRWQRKRLEIMQRDNFKCVTCGNDKLTLHVHHLSYTDNTEPWNYPDDNFKTLCKKCHSIEHDRIKITEDGGIISVPEVLKKIPGLNKYFSEIGNHKGCWELKKREDVEWDFAEEVIWTLMGYAWFDMEFDIDINGYLLNMTNCGHGNNEFYITGQSLNDEKE